MFLNVSRQACFRNPLNLRHDSRKQEERQRLAEARSSTYGRESEWVRNVIAAGGCQLETRGVRYQPPHPPSRMTRLGGGSHFLCGPYSGSLVRTISCNFRLLTQQEALRPN
jgi:hypothetical protein